MNRKFAIDFGTTNSVIACWNGATGQQKGIKDIFHAFLYNIKGSV